MARKRTVKRQSRSRMEQQAKDILQAILEDPVTQEYIILQKQLWLETLKKALNRIEEISVQEVRKAKLHALRAAKTTAKTTSARTTSSGRRANR